MKRIVMDAQKYSVLKEWSAGMFQLQELVLCVEHVQKGTLEMK